MEAPRNQRMRAPERIWEIVPKCESSSIHWFTSRMSTVADFRTKSGSREVIPDFLSGLRRPGSLNHHCCLPAQTFYVSRKLDLRAELGMDPRPSDKGHGSNTPSFLLFLSCIFFFLCKCSTFWEDLHQVHGKHILWKKLCTGFNFFTSAIIFFFKLFEFPSYIIHRHET